MKEIALNFIEFLKLVFARINSKRLMAFMSLLLYYTGSKYINNLTTQELIVTLTAYTLAEIAFVYKPKVSGV